MQYIHNAGFKWYSGPDAVENLPAGAHEQHIVNAAKSQLVNSRGGLLVDVGAHYGLYTIHLAQFVDEVWAFEPHPHNKKILEMNVQLNNIKNVRIFEMALWDDEVEVYMAPPRVPDPTIYSGRWFVDPSHGEFKVKACRLDLFKPRNLRYVKIDVEGNGHRVLKGAVETLSTNKPIIQIEYHSQAEIEMCRDILTKFGFSELLRFPYPPFHLSIWK